MPLRIHFFGNINKLHVGRPIPEGDAIYEAIHTGKEVYISVPKEAFGVPFKAVGVPVRDEHGNIIGGIGLGLSLENQTRLAEMAQHVAALAGQWLANIQEIAATAERLAENHSSLVAMFHEMALKAEKLEFINKLASTPCSGAQCRD